MVSKNDVEMVGVNEYLSIPRESGNCLGNSQRNFPQRFFSKIPSRWFYLRWVGPPPKKHGFLSRFFPQMEQINLKTRVLACLGAIAGGAKTPSLTISWPSFSRVRTPRPRQWLHVFASSAPTLAARTPNGWSWEFRVFFWGQNLGGSWLP